MDDDSSMCERILRSLESIFANDPPPKDFTVIPTETNSRNKSPVLYVEQCIGLESWCVKYVYRHAYLELFEKRKALAKNKLSFEKEQDLNHLLIGALLVNPDVSTFWNMKRELVQNDVLSAIQELLFTKVVLAYKSKSNEVFAYRRWLCKRILAKTPSNELYNVALNELEVAEMAADNSQNNYHAWTHRIWVMENVAPGVDNFYNFLLLELDFSHQWLLKHVSEHTCYHYRQYLVDTVKKSSAITSIFECYFNQVIKYLGLVNESNPRNILTFLLNKQKILQQSIEELNRLVNYICILLFDLVNTLETLNSTFPNHETIWYYRRYLIYSLIKISYACYDVPFREHDHTILDQHRDDVGVNIVSFEQSNGEKLPKLFKRIPNKVESCHLCRMLVKHEQDFIKKNLETQTDLARRHEKWLKFFINMEDV